MYIQTTGLLVLVSCLFTLKSGLSTPAYNVYKYNIICCLTSLFNIWLLYTKLDGLAICSCMQCVMWLNLLTLILVLCMWTLVYITTAFLGLLNFFNSFIVHIQYMLKIRSCCFPWSMFVLFSFCFTDCGSLYPCLSY